MRKASDDCHGHTPSNARDSEAAALYEVKKRNEALMNEIERVEAEIREINKENVQITRERDRYKRKSMEIQQSAFWRFSKRMYNLFRKIKRLLTETGKKKEQQALRRIDKIKYRLYELGFDQAASELHETITHTSNAYLKKMAAWELALWYANHYDDDGARRCLKLLPIVTKGEKDRQRLRKAAVIKAECLAQLGRHQTAKHVIEDALKTDAHHDLFLAAANLESSHSKRLNWINRVMKHHGLAGITLRPRRGGFEDKPPYDRLSADISGDAPAPAAPTVTVIMPVYNAEEVIQTSIESILHQTWRALEVIIVDDHSLDRTAEIVESYAEKDGRVRLIRMTSNAGPYVARNMALNEASGEFVTVHDADDWSHLEKIERQARHLMDNPSVIANTSEQARATESLQFYRRGRPGEYTFANMSSLMFRRKPVMKQLGYWDCVRFGADGEFKRRLKLVFGKDAVVDLKTGPLSFQRQSGQSLTGNEMFGFHGFFMGARQEYFDSYSHFHRTATSLKYAFPERSRPFPVPEPMKPDREVEPSEWRHFDVVLVSEFRLLGGTNMSNAEEIKAQKQMGLRIGLVQMSRYDFTSNRQINPAIRELIDGEQVQMLVYGEKISCDVLIIRHPPILEKRQRYIPDIKANDIRVIVNQPPQRDYGEDGEALYDIRRCAQNLHAYFGKAGTWHPIGPSVRQVMEEHHAHELHGIQWSDEDWVNIINVDEWRRPFRPEREGSKIRIGRHSRPQYVKWPDNPDELLAIYPESDDIDVYILGGAQIPRKILGRIPKNWFVLEFGEVHPKDFLAALDVFVYYTHPDWVESFGRVIFEAMAVGVPVIIPPVYRPLFGEAAIYAEPHEVRGKIRELMDDDDYYNRQVGKASDYVERHFGYAKHISRLNKIMDSSSTSPDEAGKGGSGH